MAAFGGCATQFTDDAELRSVEAVYWHGPVVQWPSVGLYRYVQPTDSQPPEGGEEPQLLLKVVFTTRVNMPKLSEEKASPFFADARFCDRRDDLVSLSSKSLYWSGWEDGPDLSWWYKEKAEKPIEYFFLMYLDGQRKETRHFTYHAFDLRHEPRDVCFTLRGGVYLELGYKSNTIVIPSAMIKTALDDRPPARH